MNIGQDAVIGLELNNPFVAPSNSVDTLLRILLSTGNSFDMTAALISGSYPAKTDQAYQKRISTWDASMHHHFDAPCFEPEAYGTPNSREASYIAAVEAVKLLANSIK